MSSILRYVLKVLTTSVTVSSFFPVGTYERSSQSLVTRSPHLELSQFLQRISVFVAKENQIREQIFMRLFQRKALSLLHWRTGLRPIFSSRYEVTSFRKLFFRGF